MEIEKHCPYCGEFIMLWVDLGGGSSQRYIEDCSVCCRPIDVRATWEEESGYIATLLRVDD